MKTLTKIIMVSLLIPLLTACWNDDDKWDDSMTYQDIATVENPDSLSMFFFWLDNNKLMKTQESNFSNYKPKDGQRIIAYYTILSNNNDTTVYDHNVKLLDVYNVLTKGIFNLTGATRDSIGNDSISIDDIWIGSDYLNVQFAYNGYNKIHFINLVSDSSQVFTDGKTHLFFRHKANGDAPYYHRKGIVSFDLKSLQSGVLPSPVNLVIHVNVPNQAEDKTFERAYDYTTLMLAPKRSYPSYMQQKIN